MLLFFITFLANFEQCLITFSTLYFCLKGELEKILFQNFYNLDVQFSGDYSFNKRSTNAFIFVAEAKMLPQTKHVFEYKIYIMSTPSWKIICKDEQIQPLPWVLNMSLVQWSTKM
jgi:hypothetical protein